MQCAMRRLTLCTHSSYIVLGRYLRYFHNVIHLLLRIKNNKIFFVCFSKVLNPPIFLSICYSIGPRSIVPIKIKAQLSPP